MSACRAGQQPERGACRRRGTYGKGGKPAPAATEVPAAKEAPAASRGGTCRVCKGTFVENGLGSCRSHPGSLRGESARKSEWDGPDERLVYTWTCCGGAEGAEGCVVGEHQTY